MPQPPPSAATTLPHSASSRRHPRTPLPPPAVQAGEYMDRNGEKVRIYAGNGTINLDPAHPDNGGLGDPFADDKSVSTRGSGGTNQSGGTQIIPIQFTGTGAPGQASAHGQGEHDMYELEREQGNRSPVSQAARTLNEARENLFRGAPAMPQRPARAPDLDLRSPEAIAAQQERDQERSPQSANIMRTSYLSGVSGTSGAPSFLSGYTTDMHLDAPKIFTSKQVQIGRLQQAEVVHFGAAGAAMAQAQHQGIPLSATSSTSNLGDSKLSPVVYTPPHVEGAPISPALSAVRSPYGQYGAEYSPYNYGESSAQLPRQLTPSSSRVKYDQDYQQDRARDEEEELPSPDRPGDLRFSMGSLAYRNSVSSMGTSRSRPAHDSVIPPTPQNQPLYHQSRSPYDPPRAGAGMTESRRESMMSSRSDGSGLSSFPMIGPGARAHGHAPGQGHGQGQGQGIPQSTSVATLDHAQLGSHPNIEQMSSSRPGAVSQKPPTSYKPVIEKSRSPQPQPRDQSQPQTRANSVADSFLGEFPFRHPTSGDDNELPSAGLRLPETAAPMTAAGTATAGARQGQGQGQNRFTAMSVASEGLGAFEFRLGPGMDEEGVPDVPELPPSAGRGKEGR